MFGMWSPSAELWTPVRVSRAINHRMYPNLKLKLWSTGMRQNRLAQMLGMDETLLSKVINGFRAVSPDVRKKIADLLEADESWLFQTTHNSPESKQRSPRES
jgi:plasmid maintenance system antidote protein VapI